MRLLIAEASPVFAGLLAQRLGTDMQVQVCSDGVEALELLKEFRPDALVLNLQLPMKDGLSVLRQSVHIPGVIIATTAYVSDYIQRMCYTLGVSQVLLLPTASCLQANLIDLLRQTGDEKEPADLRQLARIHLRNLNFQIHLIGCRELLVALPLFAANPRQKLTIELYPAVAEALDISDGRAVEHAIRTAIANAWQSRDVQVWEKYFPGGKECPNTKQFLARLTAMMIEK